MDTQFIYLEHKIEQCKIDTHLILPWWIDTRLSVSNVYI
jgi:hypothetical protein